MNLKSKRCPWCEEEPLYVAYHDNEWGVPVHDDQILFEYLILEGMQAGLSWLTILRKREGFRKAFANFDPEKVAQCSDEKLEKLFDRPDILRNKAKIKATRTNARAFLSVQKEFGSFAKYIWSFVEGKPIQNHRKEMSDVPASTPISIKMAKDLKKRGFLFVGPVICYAFMQAVGMVNDHLTSCFRHKSL